MCGSDMILVERRVSERVRLCNHENAVKFLDAMTYEKDDVFLDVHI